MKDAQQVWYEPHPLAPGRKEELRAKGFKIIDAHFAPEGWENPGDGAKEQKAKPSKTTKPKAE
jgi:hypothetical protein